MRFYLWLVMVGWMIGLPMTLMSANYYDRSREAILQRTQPLGQVQLLQSDSPLPPESTADPAQPADVALTGEQVYQKYCALCHLSGVAGAPMLTDQAQWETRLQQGKTVLLQHVLNGYNAMPAKGTCTVCSEQDLEMTIDYMLQQAGL